MVGAQKATKMASNFSPVKNIYSDTIIIERTTRSKTQFIAPIFSIKFLIILQEVSYLKIRFLDAPFFKIVKNFLTFIKFVRKTNIF